VTLNVHGKPCQRSALDKDDNDINAIGGGSSRQRDDKPYPRGQWAAAFPCSIGAPSSPSSHCIMHSESSQSVPVSCDSDVSDNISLASSYGYLTDDIPSPDSLAYSMYSNGCKPLKSRTGILSKPYNGDPVCMVCGYAMYSLVSESECIHGRI